MVIRICPDQSGWAKKTDSGPGERRLSSTAQCGCGFGQCDGARYQLCSLTLAVGHSGRRTPGWLVRTMCMTADRYIGASKQFSSHDAASRHGARYDASPSAMKARQVAKMREISQALIAEGCTSLGRQAEALGLPRSTTWTIVNAQHKSSGLSASIIERILSAPRLQPRVRKKVLEYIEEKSVGHYGGTKESLHKFVARIKSFAGATPTREIRPTDLG